MDEEVPRKAQRSHTRVIQVERNDRKNSTGMKSLSPKKGGHGGKFTWSGNDRNSLVETEFKKGAADEKDPNFEDPEEDVV